VTCINPRRRASFVVTKGGPSTDVVGRLRDGRCWWVMGHSKACGLRFAFVRRLYTVAHDKRMGLLRILGLLTGKTRQQDRERHRAQALTFAKGTPFTLLKGVLTMSPGLNLLSLVRRSSALPDKSWIGAASVHETSKVR
jgi:hypothetical protein